MYNQVVEYINTNWSIDNTQDNNIQNQDQNTIPQNSQQENQDQNNIQQNTEQTNQEQENNLDTQNAIGGGDIQDVQLQDKKEEPTQNEETAKTDEEYIKENFSFIKPVTGVVSSEFGLRNVDNPIVSKNHLGIDIAANTGTVIYAAMEGTVKVSSTVGSYGYHIKIENNDVNTLYAHCSKLYVNVGDVVKQGTPIAEVGSTGNSIRTTFTF